MNYSDKELKSALRRREPPEGFAERVLARVATERVQSTPQKEFWLAFFTQPLVRWASVAALGGALIAGGIHYRNVQRERAEGEAAKQQLMLALRIAGSKLQLAKAKVNEVNVRETDSKNRQVKE